MFKWVLKVARRDGESISKLTKSSPYRCSIAYYGAMTFSMVC
jgi:hypothetical protein